MISLVNLILNEGSSQKYDYGCVMLYFTFPQLFRIQDAINPNDLYIGDGSDGRTYGFEDEPHCTLLYGLHEEVSLEQVKSALEGTVFSECTLSNASKFDNPKYDVFKFDVSGKGLVEANKALSSLPHTTSFPDYHPHSTIAYLNKGTADKYIQMLKGEEFTLTPKRAVYSVPDGAKYDIKINLAK